MAFDGVVTKSIVYELNNCLVGGKIEKIHSPTENEILMSVYSNGIKYALNINISANNYRINLTTSVKENPPAPTNFCMVLRKHLLNSRISSIYSTDLERVVVIDFKNNYDDSMSKKLIIELMGKHSNVVLIDNQDVIINSLRHLSITNNANRNIYPKCKYVYPVSSKNNLIDIKNYNELYELVKSEENISICFPELFTGISKTFISSCLNILQMSDIPSLDNINKLYNYIFNIISNVTSNNVICGSFNNDYTLFKGAKKSNLDINFFIDDFYTSKEIEETFKSYQNNLLKLILNNIKKLEVKLKNTNIKLKECNNMNTYKLYGELITANLYKIKETHLDNIELENYYDNNSVISIPLDKAFSVSDNAKKYFKKYNKLKSAFDIVNKQKEEIESEVTYFESIVYSIQEARNVEDLDEVYQELSGTIIKPKNDKNIKKNNNITEPLKYEIDGFIAYVGRNNLQNEYLTNKLAVNSDYWFHVKDMHGSHVILKTQNNTPSQEVINKCASLAAYYSKAKYSSNVPVDYTLIKNVKKLPKSKPGLVTYTDYKTINVMPQSILPFSISSKKSCYS